jgi:ferredoxin-type protein NapH
LVDWKHSFLRIRTARFVVQFIFFLLFNAVLFGVDPQSVLLPVLQSMGNPATTVGDAFAALQYMIFQMTFPWLPLASFLIFATLLGRALCGWACPFGFIQDILSLIKRRHMEITPRTRKSLVSIKYMILALTLFISVTLSLAALTGVGGYKEGLGVFAQAPFNALSPHDTLFAVLPTMTYNAITSGESLDVLAGIGSLSPLFWTRIFILGFVLVFAVYTPRSWCRYFCPVGALMGLLNNYSFLGLKRDVVHCTKESCRRCVEVCPTKVPILDLPWEKFTHSECIYCLECVDACETKAIKPKFP